MIQNWLSRLLKWLVVCMFPNWFTCIIKKKNSYGPKLVNMFPKLVNIHGYTNVLMIPMFPNWSTSMVKKITVPNIVILFPNWFLWFTTGGHGFLMVFMISKLVLNVHKQVLIVVPTVCRLVLMSHKQVIIVSVLVLMVSKLVPTVFKLVILTPNWFSWFPNTLRVVSKLIHWFLFLCSCLCCLYF